MMHVVRLQIQDCSQLSIESSAPFVQHPRAAHLGSICQLTFSVARSGIYPWRLMYASRKIIQAGKMRVAAQATAVDPVKVLVSHLFCDARVELVAFCVLHAYMKASK